MAYSENKTRKYSHFRKIISVHTDKLFANNSGKIVVKFVAKISLSIEKNLFKICRQIFCIFDVHWITRPNGEPINDDDSVADQ